MDGPGGPQIVSSHGQEFDFTAPPFDLLTEEQARSLATRIDIEFVPAGTRLIEAGQASPALYVILKGEIAAVGDRDRAARTFAEFGPTDLFGSTAVLTGRARHSYEALEDTLAWVIPADAFRSAVESNGRFAAHFLDSLAKRSALAEATASPSDLGELMLTRVGDALLADAVIVPEDCPLDEATRRMRDRRVDCDLVRDGLPATDYFTPYYAVAAPFALVRPFLPPRRIRAVPRPVFGAVPSLHGRSQRTAVHRGHRELSRQGR